MKQIINQCLTAFFVIISMIILMFLLLLIPTSTDSAESTSRDPVLVKGTSTSFKSIFDFRMPIFEVDSSEPTDQPIIIPCESGITRKGNS